jgi:hypothetical protein
MTRFNQSVLLFAAMSLLFFGCSPDQVRPQRQGRQGRPSFEGSEVHGDLVRCSLAETMTLWGPGETPYPTQCYYFDDQVTFTTQPIDCDSIPGGNQPWGKVKIYNGYEIVDTDNDNIPDSTVNFFVADITLPDGWAIDIARTKFSATNNWTFDSLGLPQLTGTDWQTILVRPQIGQWSLLKPVSGANDCFDFAMNLGVVYLDIFTEPVIGSETQLWTHNDEWNNPNNPAYSPISPYLTHFCVWPCGVPCQVSDRCKVTYRNLNCNDGSITLSPSITSSVNQIEYNWSNNEHTANITVNPVVNSTYSVTVLESQECIKVENYNVNVIDVGCNITVLPRVEFCPVNLNLRYNETFNIRNYVRYVNGSPVNAVDWDDVIFTYTALGANNPTTPANWHLSDFMAGNNVTTTAADYNTGTGNVARGQYRIYIGRKNQATFDDYMTIRVNNSQPSSRLSAVCSYGPVCPPGGVGAGGSVTPGVKVCAIPPGNPNGGTTICVPYSQLNTYATGYCTGQTLSVVPGNTLGQCGTNPCITQ